MTRRTAVVVLSLLFTTSVLAKDVFLSVSGKANGFFTDARIFNPNYEKDITVSAQYLPSGNGNNTNATSVHITIPKRSMRVFDDAVQSIFGGSPSPLGAIRLTSEDDFVATQRIYQDARTQPQAGTLGQFVPGLDVSAARRKGVLLQLKAGQATLGNFRTNWGGVNPNTTVANIAFKLYDKNNTVVGTNNLTLQPFGVFAPTNIVGFFGSPTADLSDAWISFESDQPVFLYGSVVDNGSSDPTFVPAAEDSGIAPVVQQKTVTISAFDFQFTVTGASGLRAGDQVRFLVSGDGGPHGFRLFAPTPSTEVLIDLAEVGSTEVERIITLPAGGTYLYLCTRTLCGVGHNDMNGSFEVAASGQ